MQPTRRQFLHTAALTAGALAGTGALAACSTDDSAGEDTAERNTAVKLPAYIPYQGVAPDLPGNQDGLLNAFVRYPARPRRALPGTPLDGGSVSAFVPTGSPVPPG